MNRILTMAVALVMLACVGVAAQDKTSPRIRVAMMIEQEEFKDKASKERDKAVNLVYYALSGGKVKLAEWTGAPEEATLVVKIIAVDQKAMGSTTEWNTVYQKMETKPKISHGATGVFVIGDESVSWEARQPAGTNAWYDSNQSRVGVYVVKELEAFLKANYAKLISLQK